MDGLWWLVIALGVGAVIGAQFGAKLSTRTSPIWIIRGLAIVLILVGVRLIWRSLA